MFRNFVFESQRRARLFEKGDLKYIILDLLKDKPAHGYEIIRALEDACGGFYSPSAGSVYPTLQLLEDMGFVKSSESDGRKIYTILEEGRGFLAERQETVNKIKGHIHGWGLNNRDEFRETMHNMRELVRLIAIRMRLRAHRLEPGTLTRINSILSNAYRDIEGILQQKDNLKEEKR
jgi:DNA-binding PadR family transcriptional regulator